MNELISVIVPVYNVKEYLVECVDSIIRQSYKNLEIILIDDGSTDGSSELCDVLGKKDQRIVVVHKINGGLSDARNAGMKIAKGMFWTFVDSDDTIEKDMIEILYQNAKKYNADISMFLWFRRLRNLLSHLSQHGFADTTRELLVQTLHIQPQFP